MVLFLAAAAGATEVSLDDAMRLAVERNPNQEAAVLAATIAEISESRARLDRFTAQLGASGGPTFGMEKPWGEESTTATVATWEARGTVGVPLYSGGRVDASIERATAQSDIAQIEVALTARDLVRAAYVAWLNVKGFELQIAASEEGLKSTVDLYSQQESLIAQRAARADAEQELIRILHLDDDTVVLTGELPQISEPVTLPEDAAGWSRPEMDRQELRIAQADAEVALARSAALPTVSVTGTTGLVATAPAAGDFGTITTGGAVTPPSFDAGDLTRPTLDASLGLLVTWNPFDLLRTRDSVRQARLGVRQVEATNAAELDRIEADVRSASSRLTALRERTPLVDQQVELARDNQAIVQDLYAQGSATILDLFNAQSAFRQAAIQQASLAVDLATADLDLRWLLGVDVMPGAQP
jgi:outer membrane protein